MAALSVAFGPVYSALRLRLITYRPDVASATLAELLPGGIHAGGPPDDAPYPLLAFRLYNGQESAGYAGARHGTTLEVQLFSRPRADSDRLEALADLTAAALTSYRDYTKGVHLVTLADRDTLPPFSEAADPEVITARLVFGLVLYPVPPTF